jgi:hypothetical protein
VLRCLIFTYVTTNFLSSYRVLTFYTLTGESAPYLDNCFTGSITLPSNTSAIKMKIFFSFKEVTLKRKRCRHSSSQQHDSTVNPRNSSNRFNSQKTEFLLNNIYIKFSSYLRGNTLRLRYKDQLVNAVSEGKSLFILRTI